MSRSGYSEDYENNWDLIIWRGAVASAIKGKRGQAFLRELLEALDAMPDKRLIREELVCDGQVCALGSIGVKRGVEGLEKIDPYDHDTLSSTFGIAKALIQEIEYVNDDEGPYWGCELPETRWMRVRQWVTQQIKKENNDGA